MPEMRFRIRWPDGAMETCYSPSLVAREHFEVGESYPLSDFLLLAHKALTMASERVRAKYGHPCSRALEQLARIEARGARFIDRQGARVSVDAFYTN